LAGIVFEIELGNVTPITKNQIATLDNLSQQVAYLGHDAP
jgi:hypothetical protein